MRASNPGTTASRAAVPPPTGGSSGNGGSASAPGGGGSGSGGAGGGTGGSGDAAAAGVHVTGGEGGNVAYIGIDLGTTCSVVGAWIDTGEDQGEVKILENEEGYLTTPSVVVFADDDVLVGDNARAQAPLYPTSTVVDAKRIIGRRYADPAVQAIVREKQWPFQVAEGPLGQALIRVSVRGETKDYSPEEVSAMLLARLKRLAEAALGAPVGGAVVTVPAHFTQAQREATKTAAAMAGLKLLRLMDEPTAACIAYGISTGVNRMKLSQERNVMVIDIGGGTTGVTVATVGGGFNEYDVLATAGDTVLGGEDFDSRLAQHCAALFERRTGFQHDIRCCPRALRRLRAACERAKRALSAGDVATVRVESLMGGEDFSAVVTRDEFENMCMPLFKQCMDLVADALYDARLEPSQIHEVVLMGGSSRIPRLRQMVADVFSPTAAGGERAISTVVNPDEGEAFGATAYAAMLGGKLSKDLEDLLLLNVTPFSLGLETAGGLTHVMVDRNTKVPARHTEAFTTCSNGQLSALLQVVEGEAARVCDGRMLGRARLPLPPAPARTARVEVTFDINADLELSVHAKDVTAWRKYQQQQAAAPPAAVPKAPFEESGEERAAEPSDARSMEEEEEPEPSAAAPPLHPPTSGPIPESMMQGEGEPPRATPTAAPKIPLSAAGMAPICTVGEAAQGALSEGEEEPAPQKRRGGIEVGALQPQGGVEVGGAEVDLPVSRGGAATLLGLRGDDIEPVTGQVALPLA